MASQILNKRTINIAEFKRDPIGAFLAGKGKPVAVSHNNKPAFYCVSALLYNKLMDVLEDEELARILEERADGVLVRVSIDDL